MCSRLSKHGQLANEFNRIERMHVSPTKYKTTFVNYCLIIVQMK